MREAHDGGDVELENELFSVYLRTAFLKVHNKVGVNIWVDDKTHKETLILIEPTTSLEVTLDYVNQFPLKGFYVDELPYNELPPTEPRIIPHPNIAEEMETPHHVGDCLDMDVLRHLFPS
jgi:hypothetical protein